MAKKVDTIHVREFLLDKLETYTTGRDDSKITVIIPLLFQYLDIPKTLPLFEKLAQQCRGYFLSAILTGITATFGIAYSTPVYAEKSDNTQFKALVPLEERSYSPEVISLPSLILRESNNLAQVLSAEDEVPKKLDTAPNLKKLEEFTPAVSQATTEKEEPLLLIAEVVISGIEGELKDKVYEVISTKPGGITTRSQLQQDINAIFNTGFFRNAKAIPEDTPSGVRVTFEVEPNPVLRSVEIEGVQVFPESEIKRIFSPQYDKVLNLKVFEGGVQEVNQWYQDNGYVLGQVIGAPQVGDDGTVTLEVAEGEIQEIQVRFVGAEGETVDEEGNPIEGETREFIITREIELKPGDIFQRQTAVEDINRVFGLGIFEDVTLGLEPAPDDPNKAIVIVNLVEKSTGSMQFGFRISSTKGFSGTAGYENNNLKGINQKLSGQFIFNESNFSIQASLNSSGITSPSSTLYSLQTAGIDALNDQNLWLNKFTETLAEISNYEDDKLKLEKFSEALIYILDTENLEREKSLTVQKSSESFLEALKIAEQENKDTEAALTLNNLGNLYLSYQKYQLAIEAYQKAQKRFQKLDSPGLEFLMWLRLAKAYRANGQPNQALESYYEALNIIKKLRYETNWKIILGQAYSTLKTEWNLDNTNIEMSTSQLPLILSLLELSILVDIGTTYSILGDYQQAIYVVNSPQFLATTQRISLMFKELSESLITLIESELEIDLTKDVKGNDLPKDVKLEVEKISTQLKMEFSTLIENFPDLFTFLAFRSIYSDLNEIDSANFYKLETEKEFNGIKNAIINSSINSVAIALDLLIRKPQILGIDDPKILEILQELTINEIYLADFYKLKTEEKLNVIENTIINSLVMALDLLIKKPQILEIDDPKILEILQESTPLLVLIKQKLNNPKQTISETDLAKAVDSATKILNILLDYLENSEKIQEIDEFRPVLQVVASQIGNWLIVNVLSNNNDTDKDISIVEFMQQIRDKWPTNSPTLDTLNTHLQKELKFSLDDLEWLTGWIFLIEANEYFENGKYQKSIVAYESAIYRLDKGYNFIDDKLRKSGLLPPVFVDIFQYIVGSELNDAYVKAAETHLELKQPSQTKSSYKKALQLTKNLEKTSLTKINNNDNPKLTEIYYGITRADLALENLEEAQKSIELVIKHHEKFLPKSILSGAISSTQVNIQYGYGVANQGHIFLGLDISSNNPWTNNPTNNPWEDEEDNNKFPWREQTNFEEEKREALETYFADRQKYFDFYINILVQKHKKFPYQGFNILALQASERARINSLDILQNSDSSTNLSSEKERLLQRKSLLNKPISLKNIQQELDTNTLLLEYFLGEEKSYLWVISKDKPLQMFELPPRAEIEAKAREFYDLLTSPSGRVRPKTTAKVGQELSEMILSPIAPQLRKQRLLIVADGFLQYLPFSVLPNPTPDTVPSTKSLEGEFAPHLKPLLLEHEIVHLPSASALVALRQDRPNRSKPTEELAIFANPVFNHKDERVKKVTLEREFQPLAVKDLEKVDILYGALPETAEELSQIETLIPKSERKTFEGYDANLTNVLNGELGKFRIVHFATHGIFNSKAPERSGVVLSSIDEQGKLQSGLLSPSVAFNQMDLSGTELVVLSGCRTGFGRGYTIREGLTGLTGGFLAAGTDRIVVSLWSVEDLATRELMTRFYQRMLDKDNPMPPAQALRAAQISMWEESYWQTPYYWAAFTIQGEWR